MLSSGSGSGPPALARSRKNIRQRMNDADRLSGFVQARSAPHPCGQRERQQIYLCAGSYAIANRLEQQVYRRVGVDPIDRVLDRHIAEALE